MTLTEIVTACQAAYGARFQVSTTIILQFINTIQQVAFNRDLRAFMWFDDYLTVYQEITFSALAAGFVAADVGKVITDGTVSGTLRAFNNTKLTALIEATGTFSGTLNVTSGTAVGGTFESQAVAKGPYSWASLNPGAGSLTPYTSSAGVRRMLGVTRVTDAEFFGIVPRTSDYSFNFGPVAGQTIFENVKKYDMQRYINFVDTPDATENAYRWVYFIRPPTIASAAATEDANLLIPPEFHQTVVVEGVGRLADRTTYGDMAPEQVLGDVIKPFWDMMEQLYTPMGGNSNQTSEGSL